MLEGKLRPTALLLALFALGGGSAVAQVRGEPPCMVRFWTEARIYYPGYNHIVHLDNICGEPVTCSVSTDVDPAPQAIWLPPAGRGEVQTRMASPSRVFQARVDCDVTR